MASTMGVCYSLPLSSVSLLAFRVSVVKSSHTGAMPAADECNVLHPADLNRFP